MNAKGDVIATVDTDVIIRMILDNNQRGKAYRLVKEMGAKAYQLLAMMSEHSDSNVRWYAADLLGELAGTEGVEPIAKLVLTDDDVHTRWRAIWAASRVKNRILPILREALNDECKRWNAAVALAVLGDDSGAKILLETLRAGECWMKWEALFALREIVTKDMINIVASLIEDECEDVRREAALTLGKIGEEALPYLLKALDHGDPEVRWRAAMSIGQIGSREAIPHLKRKLRKEVNPTVKYQILKTIEEIESNSKALT